MRTEPELPAASAHDSGAQRRYGLRRAWLRIEWAVLVLAVLAAAFLLQNGAMDVPDRLIYDHLIPTLERPAPDDIVIVAIDDKSIDSLGRWPWKRGIHAQLVNVINNGAPRAIGLDLLLTESDDANAAGDQALAAALARRHNAVLPFLTSQTDSGAAPRLPVPPLAKATAAFGHIRLNIDNDGRVRSVDLRDQVGRRHWPAFAAALRQVEQPGAMPIGHNDGAPLLRIPLSGPAGHFTHVSYSDVLYGAVPATFFRDKTVLVGAVGAGLGDLFPTPYGLMSGVELHANILAALREGRTIDKPLPPVAIAFAALPALLVLLGFTFLSPRAVLALTAVLTLVVIATVIVLFGEGVWLAPSAALLLLWLVYPLWSWRRLESALRYLDEETTHVAANVPLQQRPRTAHRRWEFLERRIEAARLATRRMLDLHRFVTDNLASMPEATLVINLEGRLALFNREAHEVFAALSQPLERGQDIAVLMAAIATTERARCWPAMLLVGNAEPSIETTDPLGRIFAVRGTPSHSANGELIGWIISLSDLTALRGAEQERDQSLNFITHDMRAPQSAILAALSLYRQGKGAMDETALFARIEKSVRSTLSLADDFVLMARARSGTAKHEEVDMDAVAADAADELWALARDKQVQLSIDSDERPHWVRGERQMLVRALSNLLSNAIKYGPARGHVVCRIAYEEGASPEVVCRIEDEGPGLPAAPGQLFSAFYRADGSTQPGAGLGLNFVRTIVERHGGRVTADNLPAGGARFAVRLPAAPLE